MADYILEGNSAEVVAEIIVDGEVVSRANQNVSLVEGGGMTPEQESQLEQAVTDSAEAKATADSAETKAETAQTTATTAETKADNALSTATATSNYFWNDSEGIHITTTPDSITGKNVLINSNGLEIRNNDLSIASFEENEVSLGGDCAIRSTVNNEYKEISISSYKYEVPQGTSQNIYLGAVPRSYKTGFTITENNEYNGNSEGVISAYADRIVFDGDFTLNNEDPFFFHKGDSYDFGGNWVHCFGNATSTTQAGVRIYLPKRIGTDVSSFRISTTQSRIYGGGKAITSGFTTYSPSAVGVGLNNVGLNVTRTSGSNTLSANNIVDFQFQGTIYFD